MLWDNPLGRLLTNFFLAFYLFFLCKGYLRSCVFIECFFFLLLYDDNFISKVKLSSYKKTAMKIEKNKLIINVFDLRYSMNKKIKNINI